MLSIIIPTLNEEKYLPLLLKSIKRQNFITSSGPAINGYEIIVADAGSEDKTLEIAKKFNCKIVKGGLPAKGRNEGAGAAKGDIFLFLDADMILPSYFLVHLLNEFKKKKLDVASFPIIPLESEIDRVFYMAYNSWVKLTQDFSAHATQAVLVKMETHQAINGFDEEIKLGEDQDYAKRAARIGKFGFIDSVVAFSSLRRFKSDGRLTTYSKYFLCGFYMFFFGPVKSDIFKYKFNHYKNILPRDYLKK